LLSWTTALCLASTTPALAGLTTRTLAGVEVAPSPNARVPLSVVMHDDSGRERTLADALSDRPAVLLFADYTCQTLCGPILSIAVAGLAMTGLQPGEDFRLIVIGLDPKDSVNDARAMKHAQLGAGKLADATTFLLPNEAALRQVADA